MDAILELRKFHVQGSAQIHPLVLSGGAGTRLWPLSRALYPKQLLPLTSERTLLQETASRNLADAGFAAPIIICNDDHRFLIDEQLRQVGIEPQCILLEPVARNTGPAVTSAAIWLARTEPNALMLVQPSDHLIDSTDGFHRAVSRGLAAAERGKLVMFGVKPLRPETGYGYVQRGASLDGGDEVFLAERFVEKPDREMAERFIASGIFYWNSGIFLFSVKHYLAELGRLHPTMLEACTRAVNGAAEDLSFLRLDGAALSEAPSLSIDHAVMEHTDRAAMVLAEMAWTDIGSWHALREVGARDEEGNAVHGDVMLEDVRNSYIRSEGKLVAAVGVEDLVVVSTDDAVLVARADVAANVSGIVARLRQRNRPEPKQHVTVYRPWGYFRTVDTGDRFQVKRIMVKPGAQLSLQKHFHRAEHWVVVHGTALVQRGADKMLLRENESIYIPIGTEHRLENPGKLPLHLIEVQSGAYLGEDDIVRLADDYGRS